MNCERFEFDRTFASINMSETVENLEKINKQTEILSLSQQFKVQMK